MMWRTPSGEPLYRTHAFDASECHCSHEDWQHSVGATCAGGKTGGSCPCDARWRETGWNASAGEEA